MTLDGAGATDDYLFALGQIDLFKGDPEAALARFLTLPEESPYRALGVALASHTLGRSSDYSSSVEQLSGLDDAARWLAPAYAWAGQADQAFQALERVRAGGQPSYNFLPVPQDPVYAGLRADARWEAMLRDRGVAQDQLAAIGFNLFLPDVITSALN